MLIRFERPLNRQEIRKLHRRITILKLGSFKRYERMPFIGVTMFGLLWGFTMLTSELSWLLITAFWLAVGFGVIIWVYISMHRETRQEKRRLESALALNRADVVRIQSSEMVELEEIEDEGACFAFQVDDDRIVVLFGQDYYSTENFPSTDFELVTIKKGPTSSADFFINNRGPKLEPVRSISARVKRQLRIPEDLEVLSGKLKDLETLIGLETGRE